MRNRNNIRSFFCWMVAAMLLAVAMGSHSFPSLSAAGPAQSEEVKSTEDNPGERQEQTTVSELTLDAVVISVFSYHFSHYLLPSPQPAVGFADFSGKLFPACYSEPLFFFSYFLKVFGKHIAANAP